MTIFRVNTDRDIAKVVKAPPRAAKDPELKKALKELKDLDKWRTSLEELKRYSELNVAQARKIYAICDKKLKDKGLSKDDRGELTHVRKVAYNFTMEMKKAGFI